MRTENESDIARNYRQCRTLPGLRTTHQGMLLRLRCNRLPMMVQSVLLPPHDTATFAVELVWMTRTLTDVYLYIHTLMFHAWPEKGQQENAAAALVCNQLYLI